MAARDTSELVRTDCGSEFSYPDESGVFWQADDDFIKTGENQIAYTEQSKNCYSLPITTSARYFIRAVFF